MKQFVTLLVILHCSVFQAQEASTLQTNCSDEEVPFTERLVQSQSSYRSNYNKCLVCPLDTCNGLLKNIGFMEAQLRVLESQIEELRGIEERPKVAFSASIGGHGDTGPFSTDITLVFRNVLTNIGSAYNPATGIFSVPTRGIYYISFFYHGGTANPTRLSLFKNGQRIATASHHQGDGRAENGSNGVNLLLEAGDHLYIVLWAGSWVWDGNNIDTIFSGFLLTPL
ncbi:complement C1q-like protein 2 [Chanos chanos]|uniref:Complement C1q-like protein 2 n=1 Tax=Chanos chanos TaxID=29144 RepID=A0A6J2VTM2_CHACN|nr:complement C1q-like protein 2 [Chanos chanos]